jgi:hypothetical protein
MLPKRAAKAQEQGCRMPRGWPFEPNDATAIQDFWDALQLTWADLWGQARAAIVVNAATTTSIVPDPDDPDDPPPPPPPPLGPDIVPNPDPDDDDDDPPSDPPGPDIVPNPDPDPDDPPPPPPLGPWTASTLDPGVDEPDEEDDDPPPQPPLGPDLLPRDPDDDEEDEDDDPPPPPPPGPDLLPRDPDDDEEEDDDPPPPPPDLGVVPVGQGSADQFVFAPDFDDRGASAPEPMPAAGGAAAATPVVGDTVIDVPGLTIGDIDPDPDAWLF